MRLVDADTLYKFHVSSYDGEDLSEFSKGWNCCIKHLTQYTPTIDAVPVVHARWVKAHGMMPPEYHHRKQCSMCGGWALQDYFGRERLSHYCPNCGAKMDGGAEG